MAIESGGPAKSSHNWLALISRTFLKRCMKENNQERDAQLGTPSEANRGKHINFTDEENRIHTRSSDHDDDGKARRQQWKDGVAEGEQERDANGGHERTKDRRYGTMHMEEDDTLGI